MSPLGAVLRVPGGSQHAAHGCSVAPSSLNAVVRVCHCARRRALGPGNAPQAELEGRLRAVLGEGPQFGGEGQCPLSFLEELLEWGAPGGADLEGCFTVSESEEGKSASVDWEALAAAGCYPLLWPVPLTAAGVEVGNARGAEGLMPTAGRRAARGRGSGPRAWQLGGNGEWERPLSATACRPDAGACLGLSGGGACAARCAMPCAAAAGLCMRAPQSQPKWQWLPPRGRPAAAAHVFKLVTGREPVEPLDTLTVWDAGSARRYDIKYRKGRECHHDLQVGWASAGLPGWLQRSTPGALPVG